MNNSRNVTQKSQKDIEEEGASAARFKEHTQWREDDRGNEFDDIATGESHFWKFGEMMGNVKCAYRATFMYWRVLLGLAAQSSVMSMQPAYMNLVSGKEGGCAGVSGISSPEIFPSRLAKFVLL